jgi:predicted nucleotide-binding protein
MVNKRRIPPPPPVPASLSVEQMRKGVVRLKKLIEEVAAFDTSALTKRWGPEQNALEVNIAATLASVFGEGSAQYKRYSGAATLDRGEVYIASVPFGYGRRERDQAQEARQNVEEGKSASIQLLRAAIKWLEDEIGEASEEPPAMSDSAVSVTGPLSQKIFIVHGHDTSAQQTVARFIEKIGFEAIILAEQANQGRTIIEKIEAHGDVGFAIVLLTPDDVGGKSADSLRPRARQNVLLELGYFMAHLGRAKVCTLTKGDLEIPTDFAGVVWEALDDGNAWKMSLGRELKAAGYDIDWNKIMG